MTFVTYYDGPLFVARDTSLFDDGSVYETAEFILDTSNMKTIGAKIDFSIGESTQLNVNLNQVDNRLQGYYNVTRDTVLNEKKLDTIIPHDIFRSEIFMALNAVELEMGDTLALKVFVPTSILVSNVIIHKIGEEKIEVPYFENTMNSDVLSVQSDGGMPENIIYIAKNKQRDIVRIVIPDQKLTLNLYNLQ